MSAQELSNAIIERVIKEHKDDEVLAGYKKDAPILYTFCIYKFRIEQIFDVLRGDKKLRTFPTDNLTELETDLDEIASGFYNLYGKSGLSKLSREPTQDFIDEASTELSTAIDFRKKDDMAEYLRHLKKCREQLFSLKEHLDAVFFPLKKARNNEPNP